MPSRPVIPRVNSKTTTRDLILDAAERRFAESGFAGVSMRELATDAGLRNQASLYNHFRNKRALYEAVLARGINPIVALIAASGEAQQAAGSDRTNHKRAAASGAAGAFVDLMLDYLVAHPHLPWLIQRAALDDSRYLRYALNRLLRPLYAQGMQVLATSGGSWQPGELPHLAAGLYQLIFGYFANAKLLRVVLEGDPLGRAAVARQRRFLRAAVTQLLGGGPVEGSGPASESKRSSRQRPA